MLGPCACFMCTSVCGTETCKRTVCTYIQLSTQPRAVDIEVHTYIHMCTSTHTCTHTHTHPHTHTRTHTHIHTHTHTHTYSSLLLVHSERWVGITHTAPEPRLVLMSCLRFLRSWQSLCQSSSPCRSRLMRSTQCCWAPPGFLFFPFGLNLRSCFWGQ